MLAPSFFSNCSSLVFLIYLRPLKTASHFSLLSAFATFLSLKPPLRLRFQRSALPLIQAQPYVPACLSRSYLETVCPPRIQERTSPELLIWLVPKLMLFFRGRVPTCCLPCSWRKDPFLFPHYPQIFSISILCTMRFILFPKDDVTSKR